MNVVGVADTHTALWYLFGDRRLSVAARAFIEDAELARLKIAVSTISLVEVVYLGEKSRIIAGAFETIMRCFADAEQVFVEAPVDAAIAEAMQRVSRAQVPDMPDRIIAATGLHFGVPVITRDSEITAADVATIW